MARSMANFGFSQMRIVGELPQADATNRLGQEISQADWALATPRGHQILKQLQRFDNLEAALADCHLILGTSGKKDAYHGGFARPVLSPEKAYAEAFAFAADHHSDNSLQSALLFGPEDDGLSAQEAGLCDLLIHIPTSIEAPSMNLAMAATLIFYAFYSESLRLQNRAPVLPTSKRIKQPERERRATASEMESLVEYVLGALGETQFFKSPDPESTKARMRRVLRTWSLSQGDLFFVFEVFYQLKSWGSGSFGERNFLRRS